MKTKFAKVYQFKITLREITPPIWRRIQVPGTYTFWDLHVAIQDAMGWLDYHLHEFTVPHPEKRTAVRIGVPDEEFEEDEELLFGRKEKIAKYFTMENRFAEYEYDFGDGWEHGIKLEKILPREEGVEYPRCITGKRACPPEDVGGAGGYARFLEIIADPDHEEYHEAMTWVGGAFDPDHFDPDEICFDDPDMRWKIAWG
ncbi:MAG: plasmid pRiA4b ORF-3 family protein [Actinobacteria bacterium]|nr:plasmid pRiA4b ORF-3 family protein [Actinomycetota bacterium]